MIPKQFEKLGAWGRSGSGKSSVLKEIVAREPRVVLFDPLGNVEGAGWRKVTGQMDGVRKAVGGAGGRFNVAYQPAKRVDCVKALAELVEVLFELLEFNLKLAPAKKVKVLLAIEEMSISFPLNAERKYAVLSDLVNVGRHYGIRLVGVSQAPAQASIAFRNNLDAVVVLPLGTSTGQRTAADMIGVPLRRVSALTNFNYLATYNGTLTSGQTKK